MLQNDGIDWPKSGVDPMLNGGVEDAPKSWCGAPNAPPVPKTGALDTPAVPVLIPNVGLPNKLLVEVLVAPKEGVLAALAAGVQKLNIN